jgi:hypothetical protein
MPLKRPAKRQTVPDVTRPPREPIAVPQGVVPTGRTSAALVRPIPPQIARTPAVREITGSMYVDTERGQYLDRSTPAQPTLTRRQVESEYGRLLRAFEEGENNPGSFSSQGCRSCSSCMFCVDCVACYRCTHCTQCRDSSHLTHCSDCTGCHDSAYCERCESSSGSSYLFLCRSCSDCTYCFGCVGLAKKDFHILNVPYTKTQYFRMLKELRPEMGAR